MPIPLRDFSRLCLHTQTTRPWALAEAVQRYAAAGIKGVTVWREALAGSEGAAAGRMIRDHGLAVVSLCRGGFFVAGTAELRDRAIDENRRCLDEAAALGAPVLVLVCGAVPGQALAESELQAWCRVRLAPFKIPTQIEFRSELPKSSVGKVLKRELVESNKT